ncbi:uncharacterized protein LOC131955802 [Physella acuta]|uniref:uncharacterized protein LOC131955802 n=1 Tax=Physella acuta TaxID=109671 RepID=UPI0027DEA8D7|nr:uncharacterized protein LOC131955802 [Physella acuta]
MGSTSTSQMMENHEQNHKDPVVLPIKYTPQYKHSSLPHVLTDYGFKDTEAERLAKAKQEEKRRRKALKQQQTNNFYDADEERIQEKERERDEQCLKLVNDMYRLRDYYYKEYNSLLADKVKKQRENIKAKDEEREKKIFDEEEMKRKASHTVKKKERHTLDTLPPKLKVPKTNLYLIVGLEEKLRKEGKLKTTTDFTQFRSELQNPEVFNSTFKIHKHKDFSSYSGSVSDHESSPSHGESNDSLNSLEQRPLGLKQERSLERISESQESSRPSTTHNKWAVTQLNQSKRKSSLSQGDKIRLDVEKLFPKLEMPKLHCFTLDLTKRPPDPEEVQEDIELKAKERMRKKMARTVNKMYQLAMSNAAVAARIIDQHEDMDMVLNGPDLSDVIADHHWFQAYGLREGALQEETNYPQNSFGGPKSLSGLPSVDGPPSVSGPPSLDTRPDPLPDIPSRGSSSTSRKSQAIEICQENQSVTEETTKPPQPLTMSEIQDQCAIVEAKALSTLWNNYLRAGKQ